MSKICYVYKHFTRAHAQIIQSANTIINEYTSQGYKLTLRQLYYQFVARDIIANKITEYKRLGSIINDARLAGEIDWNAIEDRTRNLQALTHWDSPEDIIDAVAKSYREDKWSEQGHRIEVWIEKEALAGVFERICTEYDVPFFCCRGYVSQSEMHAAALRLRRYEGAGQQTIILHFGDHDPSGIDMTRDIANRLRLFECEVEVQRLALNMDQIIQYNPPPNPAKETDSRFQDYRLEHGDESWELDALEPQVLHDLVAVGVRKYRDENAWEAATVVEDERIELLTKCSKQWSEVCELLA